MPMIFFSIIAAASAAVAPFEPASEADLRCVAALANVVSETTDEKLVSAYSAGLFYFLGKIDGRHPGFDVGAQLYRLLTQTDMAAKTDQELNRCKTELGKRANELSVAAQQLEKAGK